MLYNYIVSETASRSASGIRSESKHFYDRAAVARKDRSVYRSRDIQALVPVISAVFLRSLSYKSAVIAAYGPVEVPLLNSARGSGGGRSCLCSYKNILCNGSCGNDRRNNISVYLNAVTYETFATTARSPSFPSFSIFLKPL